MYLCNTVWFEKWMSKSTKLLTSKIPSPTPEVNDLDACRIVAFPSFSSSCITRLFIMFIRRQPLSITFFNKPWVYDVPSKIGKLGLVTILLIVNVSVHVGFRVLLGMFELMPSSFPIRIVPKVGRIYWNQGKGYVIEIYI